MKIFLLNRCKDWIAATTKPMCKRYLGIFTHSQYYYHAQRSDAGEHGHFHLFIRQPGMPEGIYPIAHRGGEEWPAGEIAILHYRGPDKVKRMVPVTDATRSTSR